jgi:hypothetical protein
MAYEVGWDTSTYFQDTPKKEKVADFPIWPNERKIFQHKKGKAFAFW